MVQKNLAPPPPKAEVLFDFYPQNEAVAKVSVQFKVLPTGSQIAVFECMSCAEEMWRVQAVRIWECPNCGYQLDPKNADAVVDKARVLLEALTTKTKPEKPRKKSWAWVMWLKKLLMGKEV